MKIEHFGHVENGETVLGASKVENKYLQIK